MTIRGGTSYHTPAIFRALSKAKGSGIPAKKSDRCGGRISPCVRMIETTAGAHAHRHLSRFPTVGDDTGMADGCHYTGTMTLLTFCNGAVDRWDQRGMPGQEGVRSDWGTRIQPLSRSILPSFSSLPRRRQR